MPAISLSSQICQNPEVIAQDIDGDLVLLHPKKGQYYGSVAAGKRIWDLLAEPITISTLVDTLVREYDADREVIEADVIEFLDDMHKEGIIQIQNA